jgi:hypothetical protein
MLKTTLIAATVTAFLFAGSAGAQKLDANGRCHDASGHFAKAEVCGTASTKAAKTSKSNTAASAMTSAKPASATTPAAAGAATTGAAKPQKCKDDKGKFAKCGTPGTHPA